MRHLPGERLGEKAAVWMAQTRRARVVSHCLGSKKDFCVELPDIVHHIGESRDDRGISRLEAFWSERCVCAAGATGGGDLRLGKRAEIGRYECGKLN